MNPLDLLFGQIKNTVLNHSSPETPGPSYDPKDLLGSLSSIFGQHAKQSGSNFQDNEDYGDYHNYAQGNVRPASEDPYGDPADQQFGNVKPASQDPYGDPADQ
jgi:hypothetical protein